MRRLVRSLAHWDPAWSVLGPLLRPCKSLLRERQAWENEKWLRSELRWGAEMAARLCPDLVVRYGPCAGLRYPDVEVDAILQKLLGTYEAELHGALESLLERHAYSTIVNVGCAEGYYAVGLGRRARGARLLGFDADPKALALCSRVAAFNDVTVELRGACTPADLASLSLGGRGLVVCDCEGYEAQLFSPAVVRALAGADVLIETHDCFQDHISARVEEAFAPSHRVERIETVHDLKKARTYHRPEVEGLDRETRKRVFSELRGVYMEWLLCTPREGRA